MHCHAKYIGQPKALSEGLSTVNYAEKHSEAGSKGVKSLKEESKAE